MSIPLINAINQDYSSSESLEQVFSVLIPYIDDVETICHLGSLNRQWKEAVLSHYRSDRSQPLLLIRNRTNLKVMHHPIGRSIFRSTRRLVISSPDTEFLYRLIHSLQTSGAHLREMELVDCCVKSMQLLSDLLNDQHVRRLSFLGSSTLSTSDARSLVRRLSYRDNQQTLTIDLRKALPVESQVFEVQRLHILARSVGVIIEA